MLLEIFLTLVIPLGLDRYLPAPARNPLSDEKILLGRQLFFDPRLSRDGTISCATCHRPGRAFSDDRAISVGIEGRPGRRNVPALINRAYGRSFFWDGRATSLEAQVLKPIEDPDEMGSTVESAAARVGLPPQTLADALASFVRSILSGNSRLDRYLYGEPEPLTPDQRLGLDVFNGSCAACHRGPTFSDERFHNTGVAYRDHRFQDDGRFEVTGRESDRGAFKTPTLRDVALTAPYMHDGSLATLQDVIEFYSEGGRPNPNLDINVRPLNLTTREKAALVAMLHTLTGAPRQGLTR